MAVTLTVTRAADPYGANTLTVAGAASGQIVTFQRSYGSVPADPIPGTWQCDTSGALSYPDYLYPLDTPVTYYLYDSNRTNLLTSAVVPAVPSLDTPWIRDLVFPSLRVAPVRVIDLTGRTRAGRVTPFSVIARPYAITVGDVRSGSTGALQLYCADHDERDTVLYAISTGNPCSIRFPSPCGAIFDDLLFAPMDVTEERFGTTGACVLTVDFVEVDMSDVSTFQPVTYGIQSQNASTSDMRYGTINPPVGLAGAFATRTYADMFTSPTGVAP